jgi:general secretion pathway protein E
MILVTGPTGSGKTTTLYSMLAELTSATRNIVTIENPIEYHIRGVNQVEINERRGLTFAGTLRSILRQDPDVIMIGEIRDLETAQIAVQASLTGHLVFATLHTNDAVSAVNRLVDMGVEPFLLASSLIGVVAQRLVRRLCPECRTAVVQDLPGKTLYAAAGCAACNKTGYRGRNGIYEMLTVDDGLRRLIHGRTAEQQLRDYALAHGMRTLRQDGERWLAQGVTSLEELVRVTGE